MIEFSYCGCLSTWPGPHGDFLGRHWITIGWCWDWYCWYFITIPDLNRNELLNASLWFVLIICNLDHCSPNFPITSSLDNCQSPKKPLGEIIFENYNISNLLFLALWMTVSWHDDTLWGLLGTFFSRVIGIDSVRVLLTFHDQWIMNTGHFRKLHS